MNQFEDPVFKRLQAENCNKLGPLLRTDNDQFQEDGGGRVQRQAEGSGCKSLKRYTLPETNMAPENGWLEYWFPLGKPYFQVLC